MNITWDDVHYMEWEPMNGEWRGYEDAYVVYATTENGRVLTKDELEYLMEVLYTEFNEIRSQEAFNNR